MIPWSASFADDLVLIGRLRSIETGLPACGGLHVGSVSEYEVVLVESGSYSEKRIFVVHGCIEMSRATYSTEAGNLDTFRVDDLHKLFLTKEDVYEIGGYNSHKVALGYEVYFCKRVDLYKRRRG